MKYQLKSDPSETCQAHPHGDNMIFDNKGQLWSSPRDLFLVTWEPVPDAAPPLVEDELDRFDRDEMALATGTQQAYLADKFAELARRAQAELRRLRRQEAAVTHTLREVCDARDTVVKQRNELKAEVNRWKLALEDAAVREGAIAVERDRLKAEVEAQRQDAIGRATRIRELKAEVEALRKERDELEKDLDYIRDMAE